MIDKLKAVYKLTEVNEEQKAALKKAKKLLDAGPEVAIAALLLGMVNVPDDEPEVKEEPKEEAEVEVTPRPPATKPKPKN